MNRFTFKKRGIAAATVCLVALLIALPSFSYAKTAKTAQRKLNKSMIFDTRNHDVNRIFLPISNESTFGQNIANGSAGTFWPYPATLDAYIFGAGIWIGAQIEDGVDEQGNPVLKPLVSVGYNPNSGDSEMTPGGLPFDKTNPDYRVLMSTDDADRAIWPIRDENDNPVFSSDQDSWCQYNDFDQSEHVLDQDGIPIEERPLGILITQIGFAYSIPAYQDIVFLTYDITNKSRELRTPDGTVRFPNGQTLRDVYLGVVCDPDIGEAADDQITYFKGLYAPPGETEPLELNLGINYDDDGLEASFTNPAGVGVVGYNFMQSPKATRDVFIDPLQTILIRQGEELGMTSLKQFTLETDPRDDGERYFAMRGFDHISGEYDRFDRTEVAADQRFIQNTGPFDLAPDSTVRVVVAVLAAQDSTELLKAAYNAQKAFNLNFILPSPPPSPKLTLVPGNKKVTVVWDNSPENAPDPFYPFRGADQNYREFDFEGYRVYRSEDGSEWTLIDSCDIANADTTGRGNNSGLHYSFVDSVGLINGYPYYYAVTSYDFNSSPASLESGRSLNAQQVSPRTEPANYRPPSEMQVSQANTGDGVLQIAANVLFPFDVKSTSYTMTIDSVRGTRTRPFYHYSLDGTSESYDGVLIADLVGTEYVMAEQKSVVLNGAELAFQGRADINTYRINNVTEAGSGDAVSGLVSVVIPDRRHLYSANKFQLVFRAAGDNYTVEVTDLDNNIPVEFSSAIGGYTWGFIRINPNIFPLEETIPAAGVPKLSLPGIEISGFTKDDLSDGLTWIVNATGDRSPAKGDVYTLTFPDVANYAQTGSLDNIRVVPDPYIVRNEWEGGYEFQRLSFTNLPNRCTIRIFTISGELVKTIEHNSDGGNSAIENSQGGAAYWDLITNSERQIASGVYIYHIESEVGEKVGRFAVIR